MNMLGSPKQRMHYGLKHRYDEQAYDAVRLGTLDATAVLATTILQWLVNEAPSFEYTRTTIHATQRNVIQASYRPLLDELPLD